MTYVPQPRRKRNENITNFYERLKLHRLRDKFEATLSTSEYKDILNSVDVEYTEIELVKENGNKIHLVIPTCQL